MKNSDLSILIIGAGAVGGITAAFLKKAGFNVEIVCKYDSYARLISEHGIEVTGSGGDFTVKMTAYASVSEVKDPKDLVLLATKATDMMDSSLSLDKVLKKDGYLVSLQNGICEDELAIIVGKERVIGCVTGWGATMEAQGKLVMTSSGDFILGYPGKKTDDFLKSVAGILSVVVPVKTTDNIMGHLYAKLLINSCITSPGAICGLYLGKMLSIRKIRSIFVEIIREGIEVAEKMDVKVEAFGGKLDFEKFLSGNGIISNLRRHLLIMIIGLKYRRLKSSSLQSLERGKPTEIDYLNGYIVKNGNRLGISVPVNSIIVKMMHEIEDGKRAISVNNFDDPFFESFQ
jgi:2-dehydropantoate 2-reductase